MTRAVQVHAQAKNTLLAVELGVPGLVHRLCPGLEDLGSDLADVDRLGLPVAGLLHLLPRLFGAVD